MTLAKIIDRVLEDCSIICIAYCPICDTELDAEDKEDTDKIREHIESEHTEQELRRYLE